MTDTVTTTNTINALDPMQRLTASEFMALVEPSALTLMGDDTSEEAFEKDFKQAAQVAARYGIEPDATNRLPAWCFEVVTFNG